MRLGGRSDISSLGATLYELLALTPAVDGDSREAVLNRLTLEEPRPLRHVNGALPRDLETIVARCMAREPAHRYRAAGEVADGLRRLQDGEPIRARRTPWRVRAIAAALRWLWRRVNLGKAGGEWAFGGGRVPVDGGGPIRTVPRCAGAAGQA